MHYDDNDVADQHPFRPSKSQLKREATALQTLGERLVALPMVQLDNLPLPLDLRDALLLARRISSRSAKRRQLQLVGKLMRQVDVDPIREALATIVEYGHAAKRQQHRIEELCAALLAGDARTLSELIARYPQVDRPRIRQLVRGANQELVLGKPPKSRRLLFRYLRELEQSASH